MKEVVVVVIDGGGRGAALVKKYAKSPLVTKILAIPGNDGMHVLSKKPIKIFPTLKTADVSAIVKLCLEEKVSLVDVAQDNAVAAGLVDALDKAHIPVIGPTKKAGELEWNKAWAREFMAKYGIPQPSFTIFSSEESGTRYLKKQPDQKWFVKASGLAEGKGALPALTNKEAIEAIGSLQKFGEAGKTYLLEEWLEGEKAEEFSAFFLSDGKRVFLLGYAQDHKRVGMFDEGENTGGMGCSCPPFVVHAGVKDEVMDIAQKTIDGMAKEGRMYKGVLYIGCMVVTQKGKQKTYVIEYNARWGDPEAEVLLPGIKNDFYVIAQKLLQGTLTKQVLKQDNQSRVVISACAKGYPLDYSNVRGKQIFGLEKVQKTVGVEFYPAGVQLKKGKYYANGGRLFYVVGKGKTVIEARSRAYGALSTVSVEGNNLYYREDIGWRDVERFYNK